VKSEKLNLRIVILRRKHFKSRKIFENFHFSRKNFNRKKTPLQCSIFVALYFRIRKKLTLGIMFLPYHFKYRIGGKPLKYTISLALNFQIKKLALGSVIFCGKILIRRNTTLKFTIFCIVKFSN
jgi:hypothetical protein